MIQLNFEIVFGYDKIQHFLLYGFLAFSCGMCSYFFIKKDKWLTALRNIWYLLILIGMLDEYRQFQLPNRSAELLDAVANIVGVTIGLSIPFVLALFFRKNYISDKMHSRNIFLIILLFFLMLGLWTINEVPFTV